MKGKENHKGKNPSLVPLLLSASCTYFLSVPLFLSFDVCYPFQMTLLLWPAAKKNVTEKPEQPLKDKMGSHSSHIALAIELKGMRLRLSSVCPSLGVVFLIRLNALTVTLKRTTSSPSASFCSRAILVLGLAYHHR